MAEKKIDTIDALEGRSDRSNYRSIFKATTLFGGVQLYNVLIHVIKSKVIAVLLGPLGVGVQGLFQSALDLVKHATSFGISQSAVRDVAEAHGSGNQYRISRTVTALRRIVWGTGLLGLFVVAIFSPLFSKSSFGDVEHIVPFTLLSVILLLEQISVGQKVILQGTRRLRDLAKATAFGATLSLLLTIPFYYLWGVKGIVPAMIITAAVSLFVSWLYSRKVPVERIHLKGNEVLKEGKNMMVMGISMSISGVLAMGVAYAIRSLMRHWGGTEEVGLFQAGFVIINSYVGLVFQAISTDYYPRLAAINKDDVKCREVVSQQGVISVFLLAPLLTICIIAMPVVIKILYTEEFLAADNFIKWACLGMMFRLASWIISYLFIAKSESKLYIINETISNVNYLWISLLGYKLGGLSGIGIAFAINYIVYFLQVYLIASRRYNFSFSKDFIQSFVFQLILVASCLACILIIQNTYIRYITSGLFSLISITLAMRGINKKVDIKSILNRKLSK